MDQQVTPDQRPLSIGNSIDINTLTKFAGVVLVLVLLVLMSGTLLPDPVYQRFQTFVTIFLGIFVEAVPFLLAGSIVSGLLEIFVKPEAVDRLVPRNPYGAAFVGSLLGFAFPVCECGVVPVTRRLYQKGLPLTMGISFLLAAPVVNPVVVMSTYAAFGFGPVLILRFVVSAIVAFTVGVIFSRATGDDILLPDALQSSHHHHHHHEHDESCDHDHDHHHHHHHDHDKPANFRDRFWESMQVGGNDFIDMGRYLIIGSMMAALMQTLVPQSALLALGSGAILSVLTLMTLAFVLSICSTVDAFLALSFVNNFTTGSVLAFLTFGPMVDIKSALMFLGVFKRRVVGYLVILPLLLNLIGALIINYFTNL